MFLVFRGGGGSIEHHPLVYNIETLRIFRIKLPKVLSWINARTLTQEYQELHYKHMKHG